MQNKIERCHHGHRNDDIRGYIILISRDDFMMFLNERYHTVELSIMTTTSKSGAQHFYLQTLICSFICAVLCEYSVA